MSIKEEARAATTTTTATKVTTVTTAIKVIEDLGGLINCVGLLFGRSISADHEDH
jgi:hypothetical protein